MQRQYVLPKTLEAISRRWILNKSSIKMFLRFRRGFSSLAICLTLYLVEIVDSRGFVGTSSFIMNFVFGRMRQIPFLSENFSQAVFFVKA